MSKKEDLEQLDNNVRKLMLEATREGGDTSILPELTVVTNYLSKNNVVAEKAKSTHEEDTAKRLAAAKKRREKHEV